MTEAKKKKKKKIDGWKKKEKEKEENARFDWILSSLSHEYAQFLLERKRFTLRRPIKIPLPVIYIYIYVYRVYTYIHIFFPPYSLMTLVILARTEKSPFFGYPTASSRTERMSSSNVVL